jgi:peptidoglycan/xylan/chitin deacetylase (PgdA/CDA1 family)
LKLQRIVFALLTAAALFLIAATDQAAIPAAVQTTLPEETHFVALTFDDGPRPDTTPILLDGLRERGASATFFLVGEQIAANAELVQRMKAEGHQVGNHTWSHVQLMGLTQEKLSAEVGQTDRALRALLGEDAYWVRPPYGLVDDVQKSWFTVPLIHWSVDPEDWRLCDTEKDVAAVLSHVEPGSIILMHDSVKPSVYAALRIVDALEAKNYEFVTVRELFALYGVTPEAGTLYHSPEAWE